MGSKDKLDIGFLSRVPLVNRIQTGKYFFEHFLIESGLGDVGVYKVDTVDVPTDEVLKRGLEDGKKGRVGGTSHDGWTET